MNNKISNTDPNQKRLRRGIYLLPNIFTLGAMFAGFFAIISAVHHHLVDASWAIFVAMILDSLDGRVARLTQTQSEFGAQLDSLSDLISFGVAPAMLCYFWLLHDLAKSGWLSCFIYMACTALRLARFNSQAENCNRRYFRGLSSPVAAGSLAMLVLVCEHFKFQPIYLTYVVFIYIILVALLMVSKIRYRSYKDVDLGGKVPFMVILFILMLLVLITYSPAMTLFIIGFLYIVSGPVMFCWRVIAGSQNLKNAQHQDEDKRG